MIHSKSSSKREVNSDTGLLQEIRKTANLKKNLNLHLMEIEKKKTKQAKS